MGQVQMLRERPRFDAGKPEVRLVERSYTAPARRTKTAPYKFEIIGFSGSCLVRTIKTFAMRPISISRGALCTLLLLAGMGLGTIGFATAARAQSNSPADKDMADRYLRAAQRGDDIAQFYLGSLYSAGVG